METMVNARRRSAGSTNGLQDFLGQEIIVPAKTVGLSDSEQSLPGKVVDVNPEDNSLWCTVSGDKRWYRWHMEDVRSWLLVPRQGGVKAFNMPASSEEKPAGKGLPQPPPGKSQRPQLTGSKPRPQAPGPEQLWKYCKRCNSWKERPANFSKNHRTPDGLQFYCRCCHNRMTKFNQERRLEDRHIAEKHHVLTSPSRGTLARSATGRASLGSSKSHSTSSRSKGSRGFDVISSKIPRQQRTHATYRRDSDPSLSSHLATQQQPLKSPSPQRHSMSPCQGLNTQRSLGSDNQSSHSSAKQQVQQLSRRKPLRSPPSKSQAKESAELMLQANAVLHKLDQSLLWAAEAASAELAASGTRPSSGHNSRALPPSPLPPSPHARSPSSSVPPRVVSSASPRDHTRSKEQDWGGQDSGSNPPVGPSPVCLQQRSFSTPTQQCNGTPPSSLCSLAHSLAQMRHAAAVKPTDSTDRVNWDQQRQTQQQQGQHGSIKSPTDLRHPTAEDPPTHASSGAEDALPDAVSELTREPSQSQCPAEPSDEAGHSKGAASGASGVSQDNPVPGLSGGQQPPALRDTTPVDESGSQAAGGEDINKPGTSCREDPIGTALPPVLQVSDHTAKTGPARQPAASDTAASGKAVSEAAVKLPVRPMSAPPGPMQEVVPDLSTDPGPLPAPTPPELDPSTNSEPAEPATKKRKVPRLAASSDSGGAAKTGSPTVSAGAAASSGRRPSTGVQFAQDKHSALTKMEQPAYFASATAPIQHDSKPNAAPSLSALTAPLWLPVSSCMMPTGGSCLPTSCRPLLTGGSFLPTGGAFDPSDGISSIIRALAFGTSPEQLHGLLQDLQARGNCQQVLEELSKHFMTANVKPPSSCMGPPSLLHMLPLAMATAAEAQPQPQPASATPHGPHSSNPFTLPRPSAASSAPLPKKTTKKRSRAESSTASLEAAINNLRSDPTPTLSNFSDNSHMLPFAHLPATGNPTTNTPVTTFASSARAALLGGAARSGPNLGPTITSGGSGAGASGPGGAALELSLLLTTLQSLASLPDEQGQPHNTIATSSQAAVSQLREWLAQLQQHASDDASGEVSAAQRGQEDAIIAAQVRKEMWANLQSILAMLVSQGCSSHVHDMVHSIAVHFANEQSQSVALERRMTCVLAREKEAQKQLQQQLRGALQVLTSVQKVLGAVRMQQQRSCSNPTICKRTMSAVEQFAAGLGSDAQSVKQLSQRIAKAENAEAIAQQAVRALQKKEAAWEVELGAAQTSNAQLHKQVSELLQEKAALQKQNQQRAVRLESLDTSPTALQSDKDALARNLSHVRTTVQRGSADLTPHQG